MDCLVRDSRGSFLVGRSITRMCSTNSTIAEALATIHLVLFGKERNYRHIIFEGDAMQVVQVVNDPSQRQSSYGHIVEGIQAELQTLEQGSFNYVAREANIDAHVLAKLATTHVINSTWVEETPPRIRDLFYFLISYWNEVSIFKKEKEKYDDNNLKIMLLKYNEEFRALPGLWAIYMCVCVCV